MIPSNFTYHAPSDLEQVFSLFDTYGKQAKVLAGGHSLLPMMKFRFAEPKQLIDLAGIDALKGVTVKDKVIDIGATTTETSILNHPELKKLCPLLVEATRLIADPQVRNRGTIGGDIAHGDPGNDHPSVMLALDATFHLASAQGTRLVKADNFFLGTYQTALQEGELLTRISIPLSVASRPFGFRKLKRKTGDFATAACALTLVKEGNQCREVRIALTNLGPKSFRAEQAEYLLNSTSISEDSINAAVHLAMQACEPAKDQRGDSQYKTNMAGEMLRRALDDAMA
ncbi:FAD binding domain-containing protein [Agarilytica rhodophyticola]|uniref:FAD binding domain-containing protein n=1 Tax=Agarilytica rhodophyticola TaxID=1737490 RepID=UPI000B341BAA|nr:xanthine dehydrogenase family protein subunit M [Agarilytica rhodophyticola]